MDIKFRSKLWSTGPQLWMRLTELVILPYIQTHNTCSNETLNAASWLAWMVAQLSEHIYVQRLQNSSWHHSRLTC